MCQDRKVVVHEIPVPLRIDASCSLGPISVLRSVQLVRKGWLKGKAESRRPSEFEESGFFGGNGQVPEEETCDG